MPLKELLNFNASSKYILIYDSTARAHSHLIAYVISYGTIELKIKEFAHVFSEIILVFLKQTKYSLLIGAVEFSRIMNNFVIINANGTCENVVIFAIVHVLFEIVKEF